MYGDQGYLIVVHMGVLFGVVMFLRFDELYVVLF